MRGDAESCLRKAVALARRRGARSQELRAATSLAALWHSRGEVARARHLLAPLCRWFTEGADTSDVKAARDLLATIESARPVRAAGRRTSPSRPRFVGAGARW